MYRHHEIRNRHSHDAHNRALFMAKKVRQGSALTQRARGNGRNQRSPFVPPEDWHEPTGCGGRNFKVVIQPPGRGYRPARRTNSSSSAVAMGTAIRRTFAALIGVSSNGVNGSPTRSRRTSRHST